MSNIRKRLFVKAFKTDGTATDWDKFIISISIKKHNFGVKIQFTSKNVVYHIIFDILNI